MEKSLFEILNDIDVSKKVEEKNGLTYLSWAWAWGELKKVVPDANYTIYEDSNGRPYFTDGKTCWVKTGVTARGLEHIEYLPIMDNRNRSIPLDDVTSFDVNKSIQRSLTKAVARHGLGLYIYAGEDLPESVVKERFEPMTEEQKARLEELGAVWEKLFPYLKVRSIEEISKDQAQALINAKEAKLKNGADNN